MTDQRPESGAMTDTRLLARIWDWAGQVVEPIDAPAIARAATVRMSLYRSIALRVSATRVPAQAVTWPAFGFVLLLVLLASLAAGALLVGSQRPERPFVAPFKGLPPEGAPPSTPVTGELVLSEWGIHPWYSANVYADGRLIWDREGGPGWIEQRLTPEGIELLRSRAVELGGQYEAPASRLPESAWADRETRAFVPARFAFCYGWHPGPTGTEAGVSPLSIPDLLPDEAQAILRGATLHSPGPDTPLLDRCHDVTTQEARVLDRILTERGASRPGRATDPYYVIDDATNSLGEHVTLSLYPLMPDGVWRLGVG